MRVLTEWDSRRMLVKYGFDVPKAYLARSEAEAVKFANKIGYPIVMKIMSKDIIHKSDAGCVFLNLLNEASVVAAYHRIMENALNYKKEAEIEGVIIEEMVHGVELLVGSKFDEVFGKVVSFGIGGYLAELIKDISIRVVPVSMNDAMEMIEDIEHKKLLEGFRNLPEVNKKTLAKTIVRVSKLVRKKNIVEMDINPLFATSNRCVVGDARIVLE